MGLQEQIKKDLVTAMKARDEAKKDTLRVIMGEFSRQPDKKLADEAVIRIIRKLVKSEQEVLEKSGAPASNRFIEISESYLPRRASEADIREWIAANVDFSQYKNNMQAMREIMQHFGASADGNRVKQVLASF